MIRSKNKLKIFFSIIIILFSFLFFFKENIKKLLNTSLNDNNVIKYKFFKDLIKAVADPRYLVNDYNVNFLPETQFLDFDTFKFKINKEAKGPRYIEIVNESILLVSNNLNFYIKDIKDINFKKKYLQLDEINKDVKNLNIKSLLDTKFYNDKLYISYKKTINDNCNTVAVAVAVYNLEKLKFKELFSINECAKGSIFGGAIDIYKSINGLGLLLTTSDVKRSRDEDISRERDNRAQDDNSFYNKILYYDLDTRKIEIFSKGHRNPGSIFVDQDVIISTEHGPRGGDEINLIEKDGNYGWPISSYGDLYWSKKKNPYYKKNHKKYGYIEPIYSYVPSIGISAITKVPDNFDDYWQNNYLIASLFGNSLYRVKFDNKHSKILFSEKIFVGERIRDVKFYGGDLIILAFERGLDLGILKKKTTVEAYGNKKKRYSR